MRHWSATNIWEDRQSTIQDNTIIQHATISTRLQYASWYDPCLVESNKQQNQLDRSKILSEISEQKQLLSESKICPMWSISVAFSWQRRRRTRIKKSVNYSDDHISELTLKNRRFWKFQVKLVLLFIVTVHLHDIFIFEGFVSGNLWKKIFFFNFWFETKNAPHNMTSYQKPISLLMTNIA